MDPFSIIAGLFNWIIGRAEENKEGFDTWTEEQQERETELWEIEFEKELLGLQTAETQMQIDDLERSIGDIQTEAKYLKQETGGQATAASADVTVYSAGSGMGGSTLAGRAKIQGELSRALGAIDRQTTYDVQAVKSEIRTLESQKTAYQIQAEMTEEEEMSLWYDSLLPGDQKKAREGGYEPISGDYEWFGVAGWTKDNDFPARFF